MEFQVEFWNIASDVFRRWPKLECTPLSNVFTFSDLLTTLKENFLSVIFHFFFPFESFQIFYLLIVWDSISLYSTSQKCIFILFYHFASCKWSYYVYVTCPSSDFVHYSFVIFSKEIIIYIFFCCPPAFIIYWGDSAYWI